VELIFYATAKPESPHPYRRVMEGSRQMKTDFRPRMPSSLKKFAGLLAAFSTLLLFGCATDEGPVMDDLKRTQQAMEAQGVPHTFVGEMRRYTMEKLNDLSENEAQFINTNPPDIGSNFDQTQVSFTWKVSEDYYIEVLSTPAPCIPISVFRTKEVKYM
jgi:hypothetical protein